MKYYFSTLLALLLLSEPLLAVKLKWDIKKDERLEIVRTAGVVFLKNNIASRVYEERNIIDLTCDERDGALSHVNGVFSVFHRESGREVFLLREQYLADFTIEENGKYRVSKSDYMPNLRHVPTFPGNDVKIGERWQANAEMILKNFSVPVKMMFPVEYELTSVTKENDKDVAVIKYRFVIDKNLGGRKFPPDFPVKIAGENRGTIYWDINSGRPLDNKEIYKIIFIFNQGIGGFSSYGFEMNIETKNLVYSVVTPEQKERDRKDLEKELEKDEDVSVDTNDRGIVLRLGEVLFDFDSSNLKDKSKGTLDRIVEILRKKYPDREIVVEGHTDNIGKPDYNQDLSERRAGAVAEYLKNRGKRDKLSYRGLGQENPMWNNATKEGREKNRRVEIIIKLN